MKTRFYLAAAGVLSLGLMAVSCSGNVDPENDDNTEIAGPFTLSVDKTQIEANGEDAAKFTLTDANGNDLTASNQIKYIDFINVETGDKISKSNVFTSTANGTFTFKAKYKTEESENTVSVKAVNRVKYEKYFRKVAAYDLTDVMCVNCPSMAKALEEVADVWAKHLVILAIHGGFSQADPWMIGGMPSSLMSGFHAGGWPAAIFNLNYLMKNTERTPAGVGKIVENQIKNNPSTCGIRISSELTAEGDVRINAGITSTKDGKYNLGYMVVMDKLHFNGGYSVNNDGIYNDVVIGSSGNYMLYSNKDELSLVADKEQTDERLFDVSERQLCVKIDDSNKANCSVVVFALRKDSEGKVIIDNIAEAPLGTDTDYLLNE